MRDGIATLSGGAIVGSHTSMFQAISIDYFVIIDLVSPQTIEYARYVSKLKLQSTQVEVA